MRSALWETSVGALAALLNSGSPIEFADLFTLTLGNGTVFRWSGHDLALTGNGHTWVLGPGVWRSNVRSTVGVSVDDLTVSITDNIGTTINGQPLQTFIRAGGLVGARFQVDRAYWGPGATAPAGAVFVFAGNIGGVSGTRYQADFTVSADTNRLDINVPREVYQPQCRNTLFDSACTLRAVDFTVTGAASSNTSADLTSFSQSLGQANGYFDLGTLTMTSGSNSGVSRSVKAYASGTIIALNPWPFPVISGDTFSVIPGCDGTQSTCTTKYSNLPHFRGFPYIPLSDLIVP